MHINGAQVISIATSLAFRHSSCGQLCQFKNNTLMEDHCTRESTECVFVYKYVNTIENIYPLVKDKR